MSPVRNSIVAVIVLVLALALPAETRAQDTPTGRVILEVTGAITTTNTDNAMHYDRAMLQSFDLHSLVTETPWTSGQVTFEGVLLRDLMAAVGAGGETIAAMALNDYTVVIPLSDILSYDVILAMRRDGQPLTIRERGPLWVIYPWSTMPELQNEVYYSRSIWQLKSIEVR